MHAQRAKKAKRTPPTPQQKRIMWASYAVAAACIGLGLWFQAIHTAAMAAILVVSVASLLVKWSIPRLVQQVVFFPPVLFLLVAYGWGMFQDPQTDIYETAIRQDGVWVKADAQLTSQVAFFSEAYTQGTLEVLGSLEMDKRLALGAEDVGAYKFMGLVTDALFPGAPEGIDTRRILPIADVLYADRTVLLWSQESIRIQHERIAQEMADRLGKRVEELTMEDWAANPGTSDGVLALLTCAVKNDGRVVSVTAMPSGMYLDLEDYPVAQPLVDICADVARGGDARLPKSDDEDGGQPGASESATESL
jgi:hypothetical protein